MYTQTQLAYLAGIIDGEGCITILYYAKQRKYIPNFSVVNTDLCLIEWLVDTFSGKFYTRRPQKDRPLDKVKYEWVISQSIIDKLLPKILPFLVIKKKNAELLLKFRETYKERGFQKVPDELREIRHAFYLKIRELNRLRKMR